MSMTTSAQPASSDDEQQQVRSMRLFNSRSAVQFGVLGISGALFLNAVGVAALLVTLGMMSARPQTVSNLPALLTLRSAMTYFVMGALTAVSTAGLGYLARSFLFENKSMTALPIQIVGVSVGITSAFLFSLGAITAADALVSIAGR